uniref:Dynamin stalk domain-containing protein n=1 Tax=Terrapene triunguis TaxID=2587831 RepID=A0A674K0B5_9SAUR
MWLSNCFTSSSKASCIGHYRKTIQHEVWRFEEQYRGRELPGFTSYKTFEAIVRQRIMALEKPAIEMLKKVIEIVRKSFTEVSKDHFDDFQNLNRAAKDRIEDISKKQSEEAETIIRIHFKMEQLVYCQDNVYRQDLKVIRKETPKEAANSLNPVSLSFNFGPVQNHPAVKDMTYHLEAYFSVSLWIPTTAVFIPFQILQHALTPWVLQGWSNHREKLVGALHPLAAKLPSPPTPCPTTSCSSIPERVASLLLHLHSFPPSRCQTAVWRH